MKRAINRGLCLFFLLITGVLHTFGQDINTLGRDFYFSMMPNLGGAPTAAKLFITSTRNTSGTVTNPNTSYSVNFTVTANQVTTVNLNTAQCLTTATESVQDRVIRVQTNDTVSVFVLSEKAASTDATVILPVQALGLKYRILEYTPLSGFGGQAMVVAVEDNTQVEITPSAATRMGKPANTSFNITLNKGQSYCLESTGDLSGTSIRTVNSCKGIAVYGGVNCANIPTGCTACDHLYEQMYPIETWGKNFIYTPTRSRIFDVVRVLAHEPCSVTINGNTTSLAAGAYITQNCSTNNSLKITATKPVAVMGYNTGLSCGSSAGSYGDPDMFWISPLEQYLKEVVFSTTAYTGIDSNFVNILVKTQDTGQLYLNGNKVTTYISTVDADYMVARLKLTSGSYTVRCDNGFSAYCYGFGSANSYGFNAGSSARGLSTRVIINEELIQTNDTGYVCDNSDAYFDLSLNFPIQGILWDFGDGDTSTSLTPTHRYTQGDTMTIYIFRGGNCATTTDTLTKIIRIKPPLDITTRDTIACAGQQVTLTPTGTGGRVNTYAFDWDQGLGNGQSKQVALDTTTKYRIVLSDHCTEKMDTGYITVIVRQPIDIQMSSTDTICLGDSTIIQAWATGGDSLNRVFYWNQGLGSGSSKTVRPTTTTTYRAIVTDSCSAKNDTGYVTVVVRPALVVTGRTDSLICKGQQINLYAYATGGDNLNYIYTWDNGLGTGRVQTVSPTTTTTYRVIVTDNCTAKPDTDYVKISVLQPIVVTARTDTTFCKGQGAYLYASVTGGDSLHYTYNWIPGSVSSPVNYVQPQTTTRYVLTVGDNCTSLPGKDSVDFFVRPSLSIAVPADSVLCKGQSRLLNVSGTGGDSTYNYNWDNSLGTGSSKTVQPDTTTTYRIIVTDNCTDGADTGYVKIIIRPSLDVVARNDSTICLGETMNLYADATGGDSTAYNYTWDQGLGSGRVKNVSPSVTTTYRVIIKDNCTVASDTDYVTVFVRPALDVTARMDTVFCTGLGTTLYATATGGDNTRYTFTWTQGAGTGNYITVSPLVTTSYRVTVTDNCSTTPDSDSVVFFVRPPLNLSLPADTTICKGQVRQMKASGTGGDSTAYYFGWNNGLGNGDTKTAQPDTSTTYRVILSDNCTVKPDTHYVRINVRPGLKVTARGDSTICLGEGINLYAGATGGDSTNYTYEWDNGLGTGKTKQVFPVATTTYRVILKDNCTVNSDTDYVTIFVRPALDVTARPDTFFCNGQSTYLYATATGGDSTRYTFSWSHGLGQGNYIYQQPLITTTYYVTVTDNCSTTPDTDTVALNVRVPLSLHVPADTLICKGQVRDMYVFGTGGDSLYYEYIWNQGLGTGNNKKVQPDTSTTYMVVFTDNCTLVSDTGISKVNVRPPLDLTVRTDTGICVGEAVRLYGNASGGYTPDHYFVWDQGLDTGFEKIVTPDTTTAYQVILRDNCTIKPDTGTVVVTVSPYLKVTQRSDTTICRGEGVLLSATGTGGKVSGHYYTWDNGLGVGNYLTVFPLRTTVYRVILNDNCTSVPDTGYVTIFVRDSLSVIPRPDTIICRGEQVMLYANGTGGYAPQYIYTWNNGLDTGRTKLISPDTTTSYRVIIKDNCTVEADTATLTIQVRAPLSLQVAPDTTICIGEGVSLVSSTAGGYNPGYVIHWDNGLDSGFSKTVSPVVTTSYQAILKDYCTLLPDTANVTVAVRNPLKVFVRTDTTICVGEPVILSASGLGGDTTAYTFTWNQGVGSGNFIAVMPAVTTTYRVVLSDNCNPVNDSAEITVTVRDPLKLVIRSDSTICTGESVILYATASGGYDPQRMITWDNALGDTNYISVSPVITTTYRALVYDNCTILNDSDSVTITVRPALDAQMPADTLICRGETYRFSLQGTGGFSPNYVYTWDNGLGTGSSKSVQPTHTTRYRVILKDNCTLLEDTGYTLVGVRDSLHVSVSPDTLMCVGESTQIRAIGNGGFFAGYTFTWDNGLGQGSSAWVSPSTSTTYRVVFTDQCTKDPDTAWVKVDIRSPLTVAATGVRDICFDDTVSIHATGSGGYVPAYVYTWDNGLGTGRFQNVRPAATTLYTVTLSDGCSAPVKDTVSVNVQQLPVPRFTADSVKCYPEPVTFVNQSQFNPNSTFWWSMGDGKYSRALDTVYYYPAAGQYSVKLIVRSPEGCSDSLEKLNFVTINPKPRALFDPNPDTADILSPVIRFINQSTAATIYAWDFGDMAGISAAQNPVYEYKDTGSYPVILYAENTFGCRDTFEKTVRINDIFRFYIPDAFTPDGNGLNDVFSVNGQGVKTYSMVIVNRWGQIVFESKSPSPTWDGNYQGEPLMSGVYTYVIKVVDFENKIHQFKGTITLIR